MTTIELTKAQVIKAIEREPLLRPGAWIRGDYDTQIGSLKTRECGACAVGGVLRATLAPTCTVGRLYGIADVAAGDRVVPACRHDAPRGIFEEAVGRIRDGEPWAALSIVFEGLCDLRGRSSPTGGLRGQDLAVVRRQTVAFVRNHFPNTVRMDIDGARPRAGVKVVRARG